MLALLTRIVDLVLHVDSRRLGRTRFERAGS